jgi:hypothetical protein
MYYTVQTLMGLGKNVSQIARELKMDSSPHSRKYLTRYHNDISQSSFKY